MRLFFTLTPGRTGTMFLAKLIQANLPHVHAHHERIQWGEWGIDHPDISHMHAFNVHGNTAHVRAFWRRKLARIEQSGAETYVETSHVLMKAGLVENLRDLAQHHEVHFLQLQRPINETWLSFHQRQDFTNFGNMWMWYLDPRYPKNLVKSEPFVPLGAHGIRLWYLLEMRTRSAFYAQSCARHPHLHFHNLTLAQITNPATASAVVQRVDPSFDPATLIMPPKANSTQRPAGEQLRNLAAQFAEKVRAYDPIAAARQYTSTNVDPFAAPSS